MIDWLHARKNKGPFPQEYFFRNLSEDFSSLRNWFQIVWNHFFFFESIHFAYLESGVILSLKMITSNCNFFRLLNTHWSIPIEERTVQGFPKCLFYPTLSDFLANSPDRFVKFSPFSPIFFFKIRASQGAYFARLCRIFWQTHPTNLSDFLLNPENSFFGSRPIKEKTEKKIFSELFLR